MPIQKVTVKATWWDIIRGEPWHPNKCMIARALKRAFPEDEISAGHTNFMLNSKLIFLPEAAQEQSWAFDMYRWRARPVTFVVEVPVNGSS